MTINRLSNPAISFLIHINKQWDSAPFESLVTSHVQLVLDRKNVQWGTVSLLDAILTSVRQGLANSDCERVVLLSQNCIPLVSPEKVSDFFVKNPEGQFIGMRQMRRSGVDAWRLRHSMTRTFIPKWFSHSLLGRIQRQAGLALPALDWEDGLGGRQPYKGCLWWALSREACEHILNEYDRDERLQAYASELFGPEEIIPHTLLGNSRFRDQITHHVTYESWQKGRPSPDWLTVSDITRLTSSGFRWADLYGSGTALFARKFRVECD